MRVRAPNPTPPNPAESQMPWSKSITESSLMTEAGHISSTMYSRSRFPLRPRPWPLPGSSPLNNTFPATLLISNTKMNTAGGILNCLKEATDRMPMWLRDEYWRRAAEGRSGDQQDGPQRTCIFLDLLQE